MRVVILTCYPEMFPGSLGYSVIGNALNNKKFSLEIVNLHNFGIDKRGSVDDEPFGGGPGMVIRPDVIEKALNSITFKTDNYCKIFLTPWAKGIAIIPSGCVCWMQFRIFFLPRPGSIKTGTRPALNMAKVNITKSIP